VPRRGWSLLEGEHLEVSYDDSGTLLAKYLRGVVIDEIVNGWVYEAGGTDNYTFHHDPLRSVLGVSGHAGSVLETKRYRAFGDELSSAGSSANDLLYTGRQLETESGLYYYRARYYDPEIGRFLSEDPLGFEAGVNFYAYVENNPINANDPFGLEQAILNFAVGIQENAGTVYGGGFISTPSVIGCCLGEGDNRSFDSNAGLDQYRVGLNIDFANGAGQLIGNPSQAGLVTWQPNQWNGSTSAIFGESTASFYTPINGGVGINISATNGAPLGYALGTIDATLEFSPQTNGSVTGTAFLEPYPAFEFYQNQGGSVSTLLKRPQFSGPGLDVNVGLNGNQQAYPIGAGGGFVLYPSRPNLNSVVRVYAK